MQPQQYINARSLTKKEQEERAHFLDYFQNNLSKFTDVRPGDDSLAEPDVVVETNGAVEGYEITELWLSPAQARASKMKQSFSISGKTTFNLLNPLRIRLNDKFQAVRGDGLPKYSIPTTLLVIDRTSVPFYLNSNEFYDVNRFVMENQRILNIDMAHGSRIGIFDLATNGTPVNSVTVIQQLLGMTLVGSKVQNVQWFIPSKNLRVSIV